MKTLVMQSDHYQVETQMLLACQLCFDSDDTCIEFISIMSYINSIITTIHILKLVCVLLGLEVVVATVLCPM